MMVYVCGQRSDISPPHGYLLSRSRTSGLPSYPDSGAVPSTCRQVVIAQSSQPRPVPSANTQLTPSRMTTAIPVAFAVARIFCP